MTSVCGKGTTGTWRQVFLTTPFLRGEEYDTLVPWAVCLPPFPQPESSHGLLCPWPAGFSEYAPLQLPECRQPQVRPAILLKAPGSDECPGGGRHGSKRSEKAVERWRGMRQRKQYLLSFTNVPCMMIDISILILLMRQ